MKILIALIAGIAFGAAMAIGFLYYNPFVSHAASSPFGSGERQKLNLSYSAVADHAIVYTNSGESHVKPHPDKVLQLWEAPVRQTEVMATLLRDDADMLTGFGIKISSRSEQTRILNGEALVDSVWHVYLPGRGTMLIAQTENYWDYLRDIVVPAHWNSSNAWKGNWQENITIGPGELGTARVHGSSGKYAELESDAVEALSAKAYSAELGPVALDGRLTIELPHRETPEPSGELASNGAQ